MTDALPADTEAERAEDAAAETGVVSALQVALHVLVAALLALTLWHCVTDLSGIARGGAVALGVLFGLTYVLGTVRDRHRDQPRALRVGWLAGVSALWALLVVLVPEASYLAFPLFFLAAAVLGGRRGAVVTVLLAAVAVVALGLHRGWSVAGVVGPVVGAAVAIGIAAGIRALHRESSARQATIAELVRTRARLAERERETGRDAERARLAGELHDTVAQGLSSIAMLLRAVERSDPDHPSVDRIRLARETATQNLAETRAFVAALRPPALEGTTLDDALRRVATDVGVRYPGVEATVETQGDDAELPADLSAAILRICQEACTNAVVHGRATRITVVLRSRSDALTLSVTDDGCGFDPTAARPGSSFGLEGMERRARELGGALNVYSAQGRGTTVTARLPLPCPAGPTDEAQERHR